MYKQKILFAFAGAMFALALCQTMWIAGVIFTYDPGELHPFLRALGMIAIPAGTLVAVAGYTLGEKKLAYAMLIPAVAAVCINAWLDPFDTTQLTSADRTGAGAIAWLLSSYVVGLIYAGRKLMHLALHQSARTA